MIQTFLSRAGWFLLLLLLQVLVLNHIHIAGYATPMPYVYFLLLLPGDTPRWAFIALGFLLGLLVDLFTDTPGMAAASMCFTALIVPPLLRAFSPADSADEAFLPSVKVMGWWKFLVLAALAVLSHTALFFTIELFSFYNWISLLASIGGSAALTLLFIVAIELIRTSGQRR